jgi:tetratricopeptide (TPR) repeat protein
MRRLRLLLATALTVVVLAGADGCSSDPDVEGARLYVRQQDYPAALERLNSALATNPDNMDALVMKADVLRLQAAGEPDPAARRAIIEELQTTLQRGQTLEPDNAELARTRLATWGNEVNVGGQVLRAAGSDMNAVAGAVSAFENAVILVPDSAAGHYNLGLAHLVAGHADQAIGPLERAIERGIGDENAYVYLSRAYLSASRGADAVSMLERARGQFPDSQPIQAELLNAYAATGQGDRALGAYEAAIASDPDNALLRYNYGSTLLQAERYDEAIPQLERAIELDPSNFNAHYNLGAAFQNQAASVSERLREATNDAENARLRGERDDLLRRALPHFVEARRLAQAAGDDTAEICRALLGVYTTLGQTNEAREAGVCAGMDMN